eukprot:s1429_g3.t1
MPAPLRSNTPKTLAALSKKAPGELSLHDTASSINPPPGNSPFPPSIEADGSIRADLLAHQKRIESMINDLAEKLPQIISESLSSAAVPVKRDRRHSNSSLWSSSSIPPPEYIQQEIPFGPEASGHSKHSDPLDRIAAQRAKHHLRTPASAASVHPSPQTRTGSIRQMLWGPQSSQQGALFSNRAYSMKRPEKRKVSGVKEKVEKTIQQRRSQEFVSDSKLGRAQDFARTIVEAPLFESASGGLILLCAVLIGVEAEYSMQTIGEPSPAVFRFLNSAFNFCFACELLLRMLVDGLLFFSCYNPLIHWNVLDFTLIAFAIVEEVLLVWFSGTSGLNLSVLRTLRMLRLARILRILKVVRFFSELRIMVNGVLGSAKSLFWALLLIILVNFLFGVFFMQLSLNYLESVDSTAPLLAYFGSLPRTMMTLYQAISGGIDWGTAVATLLPVSEMLEYVFSAYVFFTVFCCLNIITGIFVDNAKALKVADEENMHHEALRERAKWINQVAELFSRIDRENRGQDTDELWELFDSSASDNIDQDKWPYHAGCVRFPRQHSLVLASLTIAPSYSLKDEFAIAIKQFHGQARSIDLFKLRKEVREISKLVQKIANHEVARASHRTWQQLGRQLRGSRWSLPRRHGPLPVRPRFRGWICSLSRPHVRRELVSRSTPGSRSIGIPSRPPKDRCRCLGNYCISRHSMRRGRWRRHVVSWSLLVFSDIASAIRYEANKSSVDWEHPLVVFQLNALQDSLAMNTQTRNMVVNEEAINALLPEGKNWNMLHAALSDAQGAGSGIGMFHRTKINSYTSKICQVVRYSFDPSMYLGLEECEMHKGDLVPHRPWCPARESYLNCVRSGTVPCVYGGDQGGPAVVVWELDEDESLFERDSGIRVPTLLWMRDDGEGELENHVVFEGCKGKLVKTLWGRLKDEVDRDIAKKVYQEILRVDLRLSWSYRAPYFLTLLTNDHEASGCSDDNSTSRFCRNMQDRYYPGDLNRRPGLVLLEEFEDPMVQMRVVPSRLYPGVQLDFTEAMAERGYTCLRFKDEVLVCWNLDDFVRPNFVQSDVGYAVSNRITKLKRGETLESHDTASLEDMSKYAAHEGAMLRLQHKPSGSWINVVALHLQTPSTDSTGEMRAHELHQLRGQLAMFASRDEYIIMGGDFNINLSPQQLHGS